MTALPVDLQKDEHVIMRVHRHTIFLLTKLIGIILLGVIPVVILLVLASTIAPPLIILAAIWGSITLIVAYFIWYRYQHDEWIITNQRLIDSLKKNWFHQSLVSTDLVNVEDMSVLKNGILQTIFNYGNLRCETAGHQSRFTLEGIPNPSAVLDTADEARDKARQSLGNSERL